MPVERWLTSSTKKTLARSEELAKRPMPTVYKHGSKLPQTPPDESPLPSPSSPSQPLVTLTALANLQDENCSKVTGPPAPPRTSTSCHAGPNAAPERPTNFKQPRRQAEPRLTPPQHRTYSTVGMTAATKVTMSLQRVGGAMGHVSEFSRFREVWAPGGQVRTLVGSRHHASPFAVVAREPSSSTVVLLRARDSAVDGFEQIGALDFPVDRYFPVSAAQAPLPALLATRLPTDTEYKHPSLASNRERRRSLHLSPQHRVRCAESSYARHAWRHLPASAVNVAYPPII
ncbi:hypothetical protein D9611_012518 [Ephemerocybe angulata]|uniref:Uncharacterized protein n=1 Tax=Ephemerocybe angulata TaxID=980116 RepID=A0A8H5CAR7_9AGAR|nr:hypothetical protein D9611_012518 [Tulosesus angulatus]